MASEAKMWYKAKDSLFTKLVKEPGIPKEFYLALHPDDIDVTDEDCIPITIERILVNREYNDFGLLVRDRLMILFEAQSVSDDNIPWRFFFYWADECKKYIEDNHLSLHGSKTVYLPRPEFYMIYCGEDDVPDVLHLSALFKGGKGDAELTIHVLRGDGNDIISQYDQFCHVLNEQKKRLGRTIEAARETVRICLERGILAEFLKARQEEVITMFDLLFNEEKIREAERREFAEEVAQEATQETTSFMQALIARLLPLGRVDELVSADRNRLDELAKEFGLQV